MIQIFNLVNVLKRVFVIFLKNPNSDRKAHIYGNSYIEFIKNKMENLLEFHPEARFIFYNPKSHMV